MVSRNAANKNAPATNVVRHDQGRKAPACQNAIINLQHEQRAHQHQHIDGEAQDESRSKAGDIVAKGRSDRIARGNHWFGLPRRRHIDDPAAVRISLAVNGPCRRGFAADAMLGFASRRRLADRRRSASRMPALVTHYDAHSRGVPHRRGARSSAAAQPRSKGPAALVETSSLHEQLKRGSHSVYNWSW